MLADDGVMTVNLFGRPSSFERSLARIVAAFGADQVWACKPTREGNTIVLALKHVTVPDRGALAGRAENIETRWEPAGPQVAAHAELSAGRRAGLPTRAAARMKSTTKSAPPDPAATGSGRPSARCRWSDRSRRRGRRPTSRHRPHPAGGAGGRQAHLAAPARLAARRRILSAEDVDRTAHRFAGGNSAQHPLVRLGSAGLTRVGDGKPLDIETLTRVAGRASGLPYLRIDPLKVDVGRVADVMSINYAERRHALPLQVGLQRGDDRDLRAASTSPGSPRSSRTPRARGRAWWWSTRSRSHRYTTEFYALVASVRAARRPARRSALASFEQLVELGKSNKQLDANDQGVVQVVDWLWQYAFDQRACDIHLEPRRERGVIRFRIDGVMHTVYQLPPGVMNAMIARIKLLGRMDVVEKRRPLDGRIKTRNPRGDEVEMRLSTLPTAFGEKMVMRIFDPDTTVKTLDALGFGSHDAQRWEELVAQAARHHPGHRADRLGQDDHALLHAAAPGHRRGQRLHDRGPDRDDRAGVQPDAGAAADSTSTSPRACAR